ncbi:FlgD immunoglobulin-like domain containing protein [Nocardioides caeni]|uniref:FlgD/Vpr Ig-like domain-containing protein n=1 Tax=Nocardioides caeni TaxID=574700 RepID=A0A4S8MZJ8_9ACTN|nr:FlgD immunoglobulin-like domain containing protein [Nocardioides caeni]THV08910.1 hypothetical protein E9934_18385 [Nocardioides caeni]
MISFVRGLAACFLLVLVGSGLVVSPATASGLNPPIIVTPSEGTIVAHDWTGPVTIDFSGSPANSWDVVIRCGVVDETEEFRTVASTTDETTTLSWTLDHRLPQHVPCTLVVAQQVGGAFASASNFGTGFAPLAATGATVTPRTFYPRVVDGYRDTATVRYSLSRPASVVITVLDAAGRTVRTHAPGVLEPGHRSWRWNGRTADGGRAELGRYRMRVTARAAGVTRRATSETVTLATKTVNTTHRLDKAGHSGAAATGGSCYVTRSAYDGTADLDCWGGRFARMRYSFSIPAGARNFRWAVTGATTGADICCDGTIRKTGSRPAARRYVVEVRVSGWRAYEVAGVRLTYAVPRVY